MAIVSDATIMRAMADKHSRLAQQQTDPHEREKYRAYAGIYYQMALRLDLQSELAGLAPIPPAHQASRHR